MMNNVVLIGRINNDIEKIENEEKTAYRLMLKVMRNFKNANGEYETDYIPIELTSYIGSNTFEYCKKNDLIGIKGRIESIEDKAIRVIADRVTFLSSNQKLATQS